MEITRTYCNVSNIAHGVGLKHTQTNPIQRVFKNIVNICTKCNKTKITFLFIHNYSKDKK